jgi:hypothetical protein
VVLIILVNISPPYILAWTKLIPHDKEKGKGGEKKGTFPLPVCIVGPVLHWTATLSF